jgi:hypothetical protein
MLELLGVLRKRVKSRSGFPMVNQGIFEALVRSDLLSAIRQGNRDMVAELVLKIAGEELDMADIEKAFGSCAAGSVGEMDPGMEETA